MFRVIDDVSFETCFVFIKKYKKKKNFKSIVSSKRYTTFEIAVKHLFPYFILSWVCFQSACNTADGSIYMQTISQR